MSLRSSGLRLLMYRKTILTKRDNDGETNHLHAKIKIG
jgi:hypothetical protein